MVNTRLNLFGKYQAWMIVDNQEVEHYGIEVNEETKVATCWIASTAGKSFELRVAKDRDVKFDCAVDVFLDGYDIVQVGDSLFNTVPARLDEVWVGKNTVKPFLFEKVELTDDEAFLDHSHKGLGSIEVRLQHMSNYKEFPRKKGKPFQTLQSDKIHETSKKAALHRVSNTYRLGKTKRTKDACFDVSFDRHEKVATFVFQYRSIEILRAKHIAPNPSPNIGASATTGAGGSSRLSATQSTKPDSRKRKAIKEEDEINNEDELELEEDRRLAELEAERERIKRARLDRMHAKKKVKCEPKLVFLPGECIDLTI